MILALRRSCKDILNTEPFNLTTASSRPDGASSSREPDSPRGWRREFVGESASGLGTLPSLDLSGLIHFSEVKNCPACRASPDNRPRLIEFPTYPVRVTGGIAEYPCAITPLAAVVRPDLFGIFLQHHSSHGGVVHIAQRRKLLPGCHSRQLIPPGILL